MGNLRIKDGAVKTPGRDPINSAVSPLERVKLPVNAEVSEAKETFPVSPFTGQLGLQLSDGTDCVRVRGSPT
jgi:hypothetical protein